MEILLNIVKYGSLVVVGAQAVVVGRALVMLALEKARQEAKPAPAEE